MTDKRLHIVTWDVPYPADYGGAVDVYYKLKYLSDLGIRIVLHSFEYGNRTEQAHLTEICDEVYYYPRLMSWKGLDATLPYIVSSRKNDDLLNNLAKDDAPILFEGVHTTYYLKHERLKTKAKFVRTHNIECNYYQQLAQHEKTFLKRIYYYWESTRLKHYELTLHEAFGFIEIALQDYDYFNNSYSKHEHLYLPGFQQHQNVTCKEGNGEYCLYHGNLSIAENEKAALFLIQEVAINLPFEIIIAGKNPSNSLKQLASEKVKIIANPSDDALHQLIRDAHIHLLPSFQNTGLKLKLLHALLVGRFCICNEAMLIGTHLHSSVYIANDAKAFQSRILELMQSTFTQEDIETRKKDLQDYLPQHNAEKLDKFIFRSE
jgi:uncharacterized protein (UPF0128 family)